MLDKKPLKIMTEYMQSVILFPDRTLIWRIGFYKEYMKLYIYWVFT